jgi:hypothetical protein
MKTPLFQPEDTPPLILFFDKESRYERLVDSGLNDIWFKHRIASFRELSAALSYVFDTCHKPDLVLIAEASWELGGAELVRQMRQKPDMSATLVYIVQLCGSVSPTELSACADRRPPPSACDAKYFGMSEAYLHLIDADHPLRVDGVVCAASLRERLPAIVSQMADGWLLQSDA